MKILKTETNQGTKKYNLKLLPLLLERKCI